MFCSDNIPAKPQLEANARQQGLLPALTSAKPSAEQTAAAMKVLQVRRTNNQSPASTFRCADQQIVADCGVRAPD